MKSIKITQQEITERILDILVNDLKLKPGAEVPDQQLKQKYRDRKGDSADIKEGLRYAEEQEWLSYDRAADTWHLTKQGHEIA